jgi:hypothetical protein
LNYFLVDGRIYMADLVVIIAQCAACISVLVVQVVVSHPSQLALYLSPTDGNCYWHSIFCVNDWNVSQRVTFLDPSSPI